MYAKPRSSWTYTVLGFDLGGHLLLRANTTLSLFGSLVPTVAIAIKWKSHIATGPGGDKTPEIMYINCS